MKLKRHIGFVLPSLAGGGAERSILNLARALVARDYKVDLMLLRCIGAYKTSIPSGVRLCYPRADKHSIELPEHYRAMCRDKDLLALADRVPRSLSQLGKLWSTYTNYDVRRTKSHRSLDVARYIRVAQPDLLYSALPSANMATVIASGNSNLPIPIIVSIRNNVGLSSSEWEKTLHREYMPRADAVVAVSNGVAADAVTAFGLDAQRVHTIYNPTPLVEIQHLAKCKLNHPWFVNSDVPIILTMLREAAQKDWSTLTTAFSLVRMQEEVRLGVLGDLSKNYRNRMMARASELGVANDITFLGFDENPYPYMRRAQLFVLSSRWEGWPNCITESLACGTCVVSTDCPYGPAEILGNGRWGRLVPVGDADALAQGILDVLRTKAIQIDALHRRAAQFSVERSVTAHESLFNTLMEKKGSLRVHETHNV